MMVWSVPDGVVDEAGLNEILYQIALAKNGVAEELDYVGQLNAIAGTDDLGAVGAMQALGATSTTLVGCANELAGTTGLGLLQAFEAWAEAGGS